MKSILNIFKQWKDILWLDAMRFAEMGSACYALGLAALLLSEKSVFAAPQYVAINQLASQSSWGCYAVLGALVTLGGVGTAWPRGRILRTVGSLMLTFLYTMIATSFLLNNIYLPGMVFHLMMSLFGSLAVVRLSVGEA